MSGGMELPRGWQMPGSDFDPAYQGSLGPLRRADEARLKAARRSLREIPEQDIEGQGVTLTETTTGETWRVLTSFVDYIDPKASGAEAFVVRDGWLVPLQKIGWKHPDDKTVEAGSIYGAKASPREPLPMPVVDIR